MVNPTPSCRPQPSKLMKLFRDECSYKSDEVEMLLAGVAEIEKASKHVEKAIECRERGMAMLARWARRGRNSAIDDVMDKTAKLFEKQAERQRIFLHDHDLFLQELKKIGDIEKRVRECEHKVEKAEQRVARIRKQIGWRSFFWHKRTAEMDDLREKENSAVIEMCEARRRLAAVQREAEVDNMIFFRAGMRGVADCYRILNAHTTVICDSFREIVELVPAVASQNVGGLVYEGVPYTTAMVESVRRHLDQDPVRLQFNPPSAGGRRPQRDRRSMPLYLPGTPPPPYSAVTPRNARSAHAASFSESQLRQLTQGICTPLSRRQVCQPTAPGFTPQSSSTPAPAPSPNVRPPRIYPDLNQLRIDVGRN